MDGTRYLSSRDHVGCFDFCTLLCIDLQLEDISVEISLATCCRNLSYSVGRGDEDQRCRRPGGENIDISFLLPDVYYIDQIIRTESDSVPRNPSTR